LKRPTNPDDSDGHADMDPDWSDEKWEHLRDVADNAAYRELGNADEASEVAQEVLAWLFIHWNAVKIKTTPEAWVSGTARYMAWEYRRHTRREPATDPRELPEKQPAYPDECEDVLNEMAFRSLIRGAGLSDEQRQVILLRYEHDLPRAEVARRLGHAEATTKEQTKRSLRKIETFLRLAREQNDE
jgi:RNA polymerase sigma factor (sigma-70 family)